IQRQFSLVGRDACLALGSRQGVVGSAARSLLLQQSPVAQPAQHQAGRQRIQSAKIPACRVVHRACSADVDQYLGFVGADCRASETTQPGMVVLGQQVVQEQRQPELVGLPIGVEFRQGQACLGGQAAHGADSGALGFGQVQVVQ